MTAARDLAATDALVARAQRGLRASRDRRGERDAEIIRDLAVEGLQAMDDIAVELRRIAALERQAADAQERAVRAEEALRQIVTDASRDGVIDAPWLTIAREALPREGEATA